eukprot:7989318-Heterocapsa_arctica.AAC.1
MDDEPERLAWTRESLDKQMAFIRESAEVEAMALLRRWEQVQRSKEALKQPSGAAGSSGDGCGNPWLAGKQRAPTEAKNDR